MLCNIDMVRASAIKSKLIPWIWQGWLAAGKLHILAGAPGTGKTNLLLFFAARISHGGESGNCWPDGSQIPSGNVVIWTGEDGIEDTIVPRLKALGANMEHIHILRGAEENNQKRPFNFARDIEILSDEMEKIGNVTFIGIDSLVQAVAGDSNKASDVRRALTPLVELAERRNCAITGITHLAKGGSKKAPLERVAGSLAFGAVARLVMVAAKIKSEPPNDGIPGNCVLVRAKSNIGPDDGK